MSLMLALFRRLLFNKDGFYLLAILALLFGLRNYQQKIRQLEIALAQKPKIETRVVTEIKTVEVAGPVVIHEKIVEPKRVIERVIVKEPVRVETIAGAMIDHKEAPLPLALISPKYRYLGFGLNPTDIERPRVRAGLTFLDRFDVGAAYETRLSPAGGAFQIEGGFRF